MAVLVSRVVLIFLLVVLPGVSGCSTVLVVKNPERRVHTNLTYRDRKEVPPTYEYSMGYFFWGFLAAEGDVDVNKICMGKSIDQVMTIHTFKNVMSTFFSLGIYSPRTVRVWCAL